MNIYAIADLHLSLAKPKEMDIFGPHWKNHWKRISSDWKKRVKEDDLVLIPGDISWAMKLDDARPDIDAICSMPGKKILIRGNHDYWWDSAAKVNSILSGDTHIIQNNCQKVGDWVVCGSRGWAFPMDSSFSAEDEKIYEREIIRLKLSLDSAAKADGEKLIVMMHYPPLYEDFTQTEFEYILSSYGVDEVIFGHLHGEILKKINLTDFEFNNVKYNLVSADYLDFKLKKIV